MILTILALLVCAGVIYAACEFFVNGVEWLGRRMNLGATAVGTVLAAFGTALPESAVTFVAVVFGHDAASKDIGVGAALGGPLVLAAIAYPVVGVALWWRLRNERTALAQPIVVDQKRLSNDQMWFLGIFVLKVALGLLVFAWKPWLSLLFVLAYGVYVRDQIRTFGNSGDEEEELEPLRFRPKDAEPSTFWCATQTITALIVIGIASQYFVHFLATLGALLDIAPHIIALLLSPVATELPETMNAVIWIRQGKHALALANISGAMMIQATIPSALGIAFTPWQFDRSLVAAAVCTALAMLWLGWKFRSGTMRVAQLIPVALMYALFAAFLVLSS
jgi:cation:H+ antiporter